MIYNLAHLRFFYDAVKAGSATAAALQNHVSQSALSQGIKKLEKDLGIQLIHHQKKRFKLTDEGQTVFTHARQIFSEVEKMYDALEALRGGIRGTVTFACTNSIARFFIPAALIRARAKYPDLTVKFHRGSLRFILQALKEAMVDFAIVVDDESFSSFEKKLIAKGEFHIYTKTSTIEEGVYVDSAKSSETRHFMKYIKDLKIIDELSGWGMVEEFVKQGLGPGILPSFMEALPMKKLNLKVPSLSYDICVIHPHGIPLSRSTQAFIDLVKMSYFRS